MKIRLYIDEDSMDQALVQALRARGVDVTTALEEDMIAKNDHLFLDYAARYGRHFIVLIAATFSIFTHNI